MTQQFIGSHAKISLGYSAFDRPIVIKVFGKKDKIPNEQQALQLVNLHKRYQQIGLELGVNINPSFDIYITESQQKTEAYINEIQPLVKNNLFTIISRTTDKTKVLCLLEVYLNTFQKIWENNFPISLDPPLSNFGLDNDDTLKYFDFYPAYQKKGDGSEFIWPVPAKNSPIYVFFKYRYFSSYQAWMIYSQFLKAVCIKKVLSPYIIRKTIKTILGKEAFSLININTNHYDKILKTITPLQSDLLRVIAGELCFVDGISYVTMAKVFKLTHIGADNELPSTNKLQLSKNLLYDAVDKITAKKTFHTNYAQLILD